ncbi:hypothetical protein ACFWJT_04580 [Streptomyces sp. NPDC127069]|uniref:hypothetical protein n=1 Tax=Streptomyces sp. NPDC127069 TaxID=3347128 RepID=UPI0036643841
MAAMIPLRKSLLVAVSAIAALVGGGSAFAATNAAPLANDPSGARIQRTSPLTTLGADRGSSYYYYYVQGQ